MKASDNARYTEQNLPKHRKFLGDLGRLVPKHPIQILVEIDVTFAWREIKKHKAETGEALSFTAWLIKCAALAVSDHKEVQAYRKGGKLLVFDDVDVGFTMERGPGSSGKGLMVAGAIVRKANEKNLRQIHDEIRAAQAEEPTLGVVVGEREEARLAGLFQSMPRFLRRLALWWYRRDPVLRKRTQGTVGITSVGTVSGETSGMWGLPIVTGPYPLMLGIGAVSRKPGLTVDDDSNIEKVEPRDYLPLSIMFDHEAVDGADAMRFLQRLGDLLKAGYGLESAKEA